MVPMSRCLNHLVDPSEREYLHHHGVSRPRHRKIWHSTGQNPSRGSRAVKGAGFRSQCVVLRRFESCPLHQINRSISAKAANGLMKYL